MATIIYVAFCILFCMGEIGGSLWVDLRISTVQCNIYAIPLRYIYIKQMHLCFCELKGVINLLIPVARMLHVELLLWVFSRLRGHCSPLQRLTNKALKP